MRTFFLQLFLISVVVSSFSQSKKELIQKTLSYYENNPLLQVNFKVWEKPLYKGDTLYYEGKYLEFSHQPLEMIRYYHQYKWGANPKPDDTLFHFRRSDSIFIARNDSFYTFQYSEYPYSWLVLGFAKFKHGEFYQSLKQSFDKMPKWKIKLNEGQIGNTRCYVLRLGKRRKRNFLGRSTAKNLYSEIWVDAETGALMVYESGFKVNKTVHFERLELSPMKKSEQAILLDSVRQLHDQTPRTLQQKPNQISSVKSDFSLSAGDTLKLSRFMDQKGDSISMLDLKQEYLVLDFWYTSCLPCIQAIPDNQEIHKALKRQNIGYYGITVNYDERSYPPEFLERFGGSYPLLYSDSQFLRSVYGLKAYPTYLIINKHGVVIDVIHGYSSNIKKKIKKAIQQDREKRNESSDEK